MNKGYVLDKGKLIYIAREAYYSSRLFEKIDNYKFEQYIYLLRVLWKYREKYTIEYRTFECLLKDIICYIKNPDIMMDYFYSNIEVDDISYVVLRSTLKKYEHDSWFQGFLNDFTLLLMEMVKRLEVKIIVKYEMLNEISKERKYIFGGVADEEYKK